MSKLVLLGDVRTETRGAVNSVTGDQAGNVCGDGSNKKIDSSHPSY